MSSITIDLKGFDNLAKKYQSRKIKVPRAIKQNTSRSVVLIASTAKKLIQKGGGGETETRYNPKRQVNPSLPNTPPATDRGNLIRSILFDVRRRGINTVGTVSANAPYALSLEFGTRKMEKRPFMRPAMRKNRKKVLRFFSKGVKDAL